MEMKGTFTEQDKENVVKFLNKVAEKAEFKMNTHDVIEYFKLLSFMQKVLLPKIDANMFEIKKVEQMEPPKEAPNKESKSIKRK